MLLRSTKCGHQATETMPKEACQFFHDCAGCGARLKPGPVTAACSVPTAQCLAHRFKQKAAVTKAPRSLAAHCDGPQSGNNRTDREHRRLPGQFKLTGHHRFGCLGPAAGEARGASFSPLGRQVARGPYRLLGYWVAPHQACEFAEYSASHLSRRDIIHSKSEARRCRPPARRSKRGRSAATRLNDISVGIGTLAGQPEQPRRVAAEDRHLVVIAQRGRRQHVVHRMFLPRDRMVAAEHDLTCTDLRHQVA